MENSAEKISLLNLFLTFLKVGAILLGGGYVILPILINEFSIRRKYVEEKDIVDYFAISQSLPGIIAANISMFIGYKLRGKIGALIAMFGIIAAPFLVIVLLASFLSQIVENSVVKGVFWGVGVAVVALIFLTAREIWQKSERDLFYYVIFILSFGAILLFGFSPMRTIIVFSVIGLVYKILTTPKEAR